MRIPRKFCQTAAAGFLVLLTAVSLGGCQQTPESERGYSPSSLTYSQALAAARIAQNQHPGCILLQAEGVSMLPKYGHNTIFVIKPIAWEALQKGMDVAYERPNGDKVVHRLVASGGDFWIIKGINNSEVDAFHVTRDNLIGQVWTAFSYDRPVNAPAP
jgi:hypothetical protein